MPRNCLLLALLACVCQACTLSSLRVDRARELGIPSSLAALEAQMDATGPITVQTVVSADWQVPLSGLINLSDAEAKRANLQDRSEPIQIYAHVIQHPRYGVYLIDTGVSRRLLADPAKYGLNWLFLRFFPLAQIQIRQSTDQIVTQLPAPLKGVFLTHMHIDHISGVPDIETSVPIFTGSGEASSRAFQNLVVQGVTDGLFSGRVSIQEWAFRATGNDALSEVLDVFGDGSFFALFVPGHTAGSTAYLARTAQGPVLFVGDTCHTAWGWDHGVEPGSYTEDQALNRRSLLALKSLVQRHPKTQVRLGHQAYP